MTGEGVSELLAAIEGRLAAGRHAFEVTVAPENGQGLAWLHENAEILDRKVQEDGSSVLQVRLAPGREPLFLSRFPGARAI